ncbi:MAG: Na+/H+ antiporter NhaC family protein [Faecalibacterium sp.]|jgi:H+/gluconate symporter-like permease|nr:Na+/H+ antiporter NhaC family protein [Faecalibacterium sp.]
MLQGILIILAFVAVAALMMTKKIPTLLALPLMAVLICVIAGVPMVATDADGNAIGWLATVFEAGTVRMGSAIMAVIFGAWLGQLMNKTGVTETIIKKSAELGGDRPFVVTMIMVVACAILFTTLSGLGSIIMVGSIILPILISVGVPAASAACIFLMAFTTGLACNIANWKTFASIFSLDVAQIQSFEIYLMIASAVATIALVIVEFKRNGIKFAFSAPAEDVPETKQLSGVRGGLAMLTPLIPIVLVAVFKCPVTVAFTVGIIWCLVFTAKGFSKAMNMLAKTCYDGVTDSGPAVILMVGIGILFLAVTNATVKEVLNPFLLAVTPKSMITYIIFFAVLAPLALYRGPMNMFGLGSGIAALIIGLGTMNPLAVMAAFLAAERIQCGADPTNTQNVWTANFCEVDVNTCTKKMLPYLWIVSIVGVILGAVLYF